jgi:hypothetical protein
MGLNKIKLGELCFGSTIAFRKRDRVLDRARRVSEKRDLVSESRSHFRIAIAFQNLDRILEFDRILVHVTFGKNDLASEAGPCFGRR